MFVPQGQNIQAVEVLRKGLGNPKVDRQQRCVESDLKRTKTRWFISLAAGQDEEVDLCCKDHNLQQLSFSGLLRC